MRRLFRFRGLYPEACFFARRQMASFTGLGNTNETFVNRFFDKNFSPFIDNKSTGGQGPRPCSREGARWG